MFRTLDQADLKGKRVLVRVDLNVPVQNGKVTDATRIERIAPTIAELSDKGAKVILLSHFGRPKGPDDSMLAGADRQATAEALAGPSRLRRIASATRRRRRRRHETRAACCARRTSASTPARRRTTRPSPNSSPPGRHLSSTTPSRPRTAPTPRRRAGRHAAGLCRPHDAGRARRAGEGVGDADRPPAAIVGGAKVSSKLDLLGNVLDRVDVLVIGGGMANTFLSAGQPMSASRCASMTLARPRARSWPRRRPRR